jgi:hypothetical protein
MSLNIEPRLQIVIDAHLAIARQTFVKDVPDTESLATSILLMLAGRRLAKLEVANGKPVWVAGKDLARADKLLGSKPLALSSLCRGSGDEPRGAKMSGSMKIVLAEFVNQARNKSAASADSKDQITEDYVLLTLAGLGSACWHKDPTGEPVWVPTISGIEQFNELSTSEATGIRMDETLTEVAGFFSQFGQRQFGSELDMASTKLAMLHTLEIGGDAVAYKDFDGVLAWKASEQMQEHFR